MSDEERLSRLLKRGKGRAVLAGDVQRVEDLVERLRKSGKARRGSSELPARSLTDLRRGVAPRKRGGPVGE